MRRQPERKGFTLIELLVVIAIIAILAAILFPVFVNVKKKAKQTACLNNMKQIGMAFMQYLSDNNEVFPIMWGTLEGDTIVNQTDQRMPGFWYVTSNGYVSARSVCWMDRVHRYVKSLDVWKCPNNLCWLKNAQKPAGRFPDAYYGYNGRINGYMLDPNRPVKSTQIGRPMRVVLVIDYAYYAGGAYIMETVVRSGATFYKSQYPDIFFPHNDGANCVFCDGHAQWYSRESELAQPPTDYHKNWSYWLQ